MKFTIYKNSFLATIISIIGAGTSLGGLIALFSGAWIGGIIAVVCGVALSVLAAKVSERKANKTANKQQNNK